MEKKFQLKEEFKSILINNYQAAPQSVDFQSESTRRQINQNVEDFTRKKITDLLSSGILFIIPGFNEIITHFPLF